MAAVEWAPQRQKQHWGPTRRTISSRIREHLEVPFGTLPGPSRQTLPSPRPRLEPRRRRKPGGQWDRHSITQHIQHSTQHKTKAADSTSSTHVTSVVSNTQPCPHKCVGQYTQSAVPPKLTGTELSRDTWQQEMTAEATPPPPTACPAFMATPPQTALHCHGAATLPKCHCRYAAGLRTPVVPHTAPKSRRSSRGRHTSSAARTGRRAGRRCCAAPTTATGTCRSRRR